MQQNPGSPQGDGPHANHEAQTGQQHGQVSGAVADGGHGPSSSPTNAGASSGEESTPWLDHLESYGVASLNLPQSVPNAFAIPSASSGSNSQGEDNDADNDVDMENSTAPHAPVLPFHLADLPANQTAAAAAAASMAFGVAPGSAEFPSANNSEASPPASVQPTGSIETDEETDNGLAEQSGGTNPWPSDDSQQQNQTDPVIYGSVNMALGEFLQSWAHANRVQTTEQTHDLRFEVPLISKKVDNEVGRKVEEIRYQDLHGDQCDLQGLNWSYMGTTRTIARARRRASYRNYVNVFGSDSLHVNVFQDADSTDTHVSAGEDYFRYRRMLVRHDVHLAHFQLRSIFACTSRSQLFYPTRRGIYRLNPTTKGGAVAIDLGQFAGSNNSVTTLDADCGVLVGGTYLGEYVIKSLNSSDKATYTEGSIACGPLALTNHVRVHRTRYSQKPVVTIASNDRVLRTMDIETETFTCNVRYDYPINCTALSADRRLRIHVGDEAAVTVCCADTGRSAVTLGGHRDYGFTCDWAEDGIHVATGSQDKRVKIWDARKWTDTRGHGTPLASIWCEMAGARSLRFSPLSSGASVLVAAEEADYVSIFDLKTLQKKQTIDVFGELGGVNFSDDGNELNILVTDGSRGGVIQLDHCKIGATDRRSAISRFVKPF